jgi:hypothetical protein
MITSRSVNIYGWVSIGVMATLLVLVWLKILPPSLHLPAFIVAVLLFLGRLGLRVILARQHRVSDSEEPPVGLN